MFLKKLLATALYRHFRLLFVAIYCLSSPLFCHQYREFAKHLLVLFVGQFGDLYGSDQYVYNVHSLVHLSDDVTKFGELDSFSSFPFESFLGQLKKLVRKPNCPLQQVIRRISEKEAQNFNGSLKMPESGIARKRHRHGPVLREFSAFCQFQDLSLPNAFL